MLLLRTCAIGWLLPGAGYLLKRRYWQFVIFLGLISATVAMGSVLHGSNVWPHAEDLRGLDGFSATIARAAAAGKFLAGGPFFVAAMLHSNTIAQGRIHEFGTTLLTIAGLLNVLAIEDSRR